MHLLIKIRNDERGTLNFHILIISLLRFFKQLLLIFSIQQMASGVFRLIAGVCRTMIIANTGGALTLLLVFLLGGFILPKSPYTVLIHYFMHTKKNTRQWS